MGRPRKEEARDTRQAALDAALELFARQGFAGTSLRQIAQSIGIRESALYHYFDSKDALLAELISAYGPARAEQLTGLGDRLAELGVRGLLRAIAQEISGAWTTEREQLFMRVMIGGGAGAARGDFNFRAQIERAIRMLAAFFTRLIRARHIRSHDPELLAREFMGPLLMARMAYLVMTDPPDERKFRRAVTEHVEFFADAIGAPPRRTLRSARRARRRS